MGSSGAARDPLEISLYREMERGPFLVEEQEIERRATELHRSVQDGVAESLAVAAGCVVYYEPDLLPSISPVIMPHGVILLRPNSDKRLAELTVLREVALWELRTAPHSRADAWRLALALALPLPLPRAITVGDACAMASIPQWAVKARLAMPTARVSG